MCQSSSKRRCRAGRARGSGSVQRLRGEPAAHHEAFADQLRDLLRRASAFPASGPRISRAAVRPPITTAAAITPVAFAAAFSSFDPITRPSLRKAAGRLPGSVRYARRPPGRGVHPLEVTDSAVQCEWPLSSPF